MNTGVTAETNATTYRLRAQHFSSASPARWLAHKETRPFIKGRSYFICTHRERTRESPVAALLSCWRKWQSAFSDSTIYANAQMEIKFIKNQSQEWLARTQETRRALCTPFCFGYINIAPPALFARGGSEICTPNKLSSGLRQLQSVHTPLIFAIISSRRPTRI